MSHTWREVLRAAGRRNRIPRRPARIGMTSAELHLCEDLTQTGRRAAEGRDGKAITFFHFRRISKRSVACQKNKSWKNTNRSSPATAPHLRRSAELCSFPPAEPSPLRPLTPFPRQNFCTWMDSLFRSVPVRIDVHRRGTAASVGARTSLNGLSLDLFTPFLCSSR